jgi:hypothetical protein
LWPNKGQQKKKGQSWGRLGHKQLIKVYTSPHFLVIGKSLVKNFGNLCFVELPLFNLILPNLFIGKCGALLHEHIFLL